MARKGRDLAAANKTRGPRHSINAYVGDAAAKERELLGLNVDPDASAVTFCYGLRTLDLPVDERRPQPSRIRRIGSSTEPRKEHAMTRQPSTGLNLRLLLYSAAMNAAKLEHERQQAERDGAHVCVEADNAENYYRWLAQQSQQYSDRETEN